MSKVADAAQDGGAAQTGAGRTQTSKSETAGGWGEVARQTLWIDGCLPDYSTNLCDMARTLRMVADVVI